MALFLVLHQIQDGGQPPPWKIFNGRISAEVYAIHFYGRFFRAPILYSAHCPVIFAIAQLSSFLHYVLYCRESSVV